MADQHFIIHTSDAPSFYLDACMFQGVKDVPSFHECVEVPAELVERWIAMQQEHSRLWDELHALQRKQHKHVPSVMDAVTDLYREGA